LKNIILLLAIVGFLLIFSCKKDNSSNDNLYIPVAADVTANATLAELQQGRELYINFCGVCHSLYSPESYSVTEWKSNISRMAPKTSMNAAQLTVVTKYVCRGKQ